VKNVPLSVNEDVLASARRQAAKHNSTVNALVRQFLTGIAEDEDRAKKARAKLRRFP
jgi:hypothetical protein